MLASHPSCAPRVQVKGLTCRTMYVLQPSFFPLEKSIESGGIGLAQEPKVEYVVLTRATHHIICLVDYSSEDMEDVLFDL